MRHFVAYHNRAKMGEHARPFQVYTNKSIRDLKGSVVEPTTAPINSHARMLICRVSLGSRSTSRDPFR